MTSFAAVRFLFLGDPGNPSAPPALGREPVNAAVRADDRLIWDPTFPRARATFGISAAQCRLLDGILSWCSSRRLMPVGMDSPSFLSDPDLLGAASAAGWSLIAASACFSPGDFWEEEATLSEVAARLLGPPHVLNSLSRELAAARAEIVAVRDALQPSEDEPDPYDRRGAAGGDSVLLAARTSRQARDASRALLRFGSEMIGTFGAQHPDLNEDGLPARPGALASAIASRAVVAAQEPALRGAAEAVLRQLPAFAKDAILSGAEHYDGILVDGISDSAAEEACRKLSGHAFHATLRMLRDCLDLPVPLPTTRRAVSPGAEATIGAVFPVLDRGEVELIDYMGTDEEIARIARCSTRSERTDLAILGYLLRNRHSSPLEFGKLVLRMKLPIFVARQFVRHRTGSFSEVSGRYRPPIGDVYVPAPDFVQAAPDPKGGIKQGRGGDLPAGQVRVVREVMAQAADEARWTNSLLRGERNPDNGGAGLFDDGEETFPGIAAELARSVMPLGTYTEWYWTTDAWNLMGWLSLRLDGHAQKEARAYAEVVSRIFDAWLPALSAAFRTYRLTARTFSGKELDVLGVLLGGLEPLWTDDGIDLRQGTVLRALCDEAGMSSGEVTEFVAKVRWSLDLRKEKGRRAHVAGSDGVLTTGAWPREPGPDAPRGPLWDVAEAPFPGWPSTSDLSYRVATYGGVLEEIVAGPAGAPSATLRCSGLDQERLRLLRASLPAGCDAEMIGEESSR